MMPVLTLRSLETLLQMAVEFLIETVALLACLVVSYT